MLIASRTNESTIKDEINVFVSFLNDTLKDMQSNTSNIKEIIKEIARINLDNKKGCE